MSQVYEQTSNVHEEFQDDMRDFLHNYDQVYMKFVGEEEYNRYHSWLQSLQNPPPRQIPRNRKQD